MANSEMPETASLEDGAVRIGKWRYRRVTKDGLCEARHNDDASWHYVKATFFAYEAVPALATALEEVERMRERVRCLDLKVTELARLFRALEPDRGTDLSGQVMEQDPDQQVQP